MYTRRRDVHGGRWGNMDRSWKRIARASRASLTTPSLRTSNRSKALQRSSTNTLLLDKPCNPLQSPCLAVVHILFEGEAEAGMAGRIAVGRTAGPGTLAVVAEGSSRPVQEEALLRTPGVSTARACVGSVLTSRWVVLLAAAAAVVVFVGHEGG
ncbi:hypothetical protein BD413DRAFT_568837 [Trametes elegans]|nr:hypothetical protein BD413DRAFT_568837 [Trametes elegans]